MKLATFAAALIAASSLALADAAQADPSGTLEFGYAHTQMPNAPPDGFHFDALEFRGGFQFAKHWGVEAEGAFGLNSDKFKVSVLDVAIRQDREIGLFGVGYLPLGHNIDLIGRAGYSSTQLTVSVAGLALSGQADGAALGVGVRQFPGGGKNGWRLDYTHDFYPRLATDALDIAYVRRF